MVLVDSSAWIEWLIGSPTGERLAGQLPDRADWLVPTMVQLELNKWPTCEVGEDEADQVIAFTQVCQVVPLDTEIALMAAEACREHKLATADAIMFATAQARGAALLTCDTHFRGSAGCHPDREGQELSSDPPAVIHLFGAIGNHPGRLRQLIVPRFENPSTGYLRSIKTRDGWTAVPPPPPPAPRCAFSRSGRGRIFPLFSKVMRTG